MVCGEASYGCRLGSWRGNTVVLGIFGEGSFSYDVFVGNTGVSGVWEASEVSGQSQEASWLRGVWESILSADSDWVKRVLRTGHREMLLQPVAACQN